MATTETPQENQDSTGNPGQDEFDKLIDQNFSPGDERTMEDRAKKGSVEDLATAERIANDNTELDEKSEIVDLSKKEGEPSYYKKPKKDKQNFGQKLNASMSLKRYLIIGGFGAIIISMVFLLFSFLNVFKLDGLMSSIESRSFLRNNATLDTRSSKLINAYVTARLLDIGDSPNFSNPDYTKDDNVLFRAKGVDNNNPFYDWYKTLRTSSFEQEVFEKHGIKFTSMVTADGKLTAAKINIEGQKTIDFNIPESEYKLIRAGDIPTLNKYSAYVQVQTFDNNKDARREIKKVIKDNTRWYDVYKRRPLRKDIQNMTGVKDWRFFETSRDKLAQKRIDVRNKILEKMIPDTGLMAQVTRCLFGLSKCTPNRDVAAPQNKFDSSELTKGDSADTRNKDQVANEEQLASAEVDSVLISDTLKRILAAANVFSRIINIPSTLDMLSYVNDNIPKLVKLVVIARGAQAAGLYQVFTTSRDQIKTGQVTSEEVNDFMKVVSTAGNSDGQVKVIDGKGDPNIAYSDGACSQQNQALQQKDPEEYKKRFGDYAYLCANQRIGNAANAQMVQDAYNNTVGHLISPIAAAWDAANSGPLKIIIQPIRWLGNLVNAISSKIFTEVLNILNLQDNVSQAVGWLFGKVSNFLGVSILNGNEPPGVMFNWLVQGGAYSAESASRMAGASITTTESQATSQKNIAVYYSDKQATTSLYAKVASLDNTDSLAFKGATYLSGLKSDTGYSVMSVASSIKSSLFSSFGKIANEKALAAAPSGYSASKFAGIETYDYPQQCYDMNPITAQPLTGTNVMQIFQQNGIQVPAADSTSLNTWETETNSDEFYKVVYDILKNVDNPDDIAVKIYNCNLLDTVVRGNLGYLFGYTNDNADLAQ